MAVRTVRLAAGTLGTALTEHVVYTCPAGVTAICKDIRVSKNDAATQDIYVGARSGPTRTWIIFGPMPAPKSIDSVQGFIVLEPGDTLTVFGTLTGGWSFYISGSELQGVAP